MGDNKKSEYDKGFEAGREMGYQYGLWCLNLAAMHLFHDLLGWIGDSMKTGKDVGELRTVFERFIAANSPNKPDINRQKDGKKNETKSPVCPECGAAATCDELGNLICTNLQCTWQRDENPLFDD